MATIMDLCITWALLAPRGFRYLPQQLHGSGTDEVCLVQHRLCPDCRAGDPVHEPHCPTLWGPGTRIIHGKGSSKNSKIIAPLLSDVDQKFLDMALDLILECAYGTETRLLKPGE